MKMLKLILYIITITLLVGCLKRLESCHNKIVLGTTRPSLFESSHIYFVNPNDKGEAQCRLPENLGGIPKWSPDGKWIVYSTEYNGHPESQQIYIVPSLSGKAIQITNEKDGASNPDWSSDGSRIVYEGTNGIYTSDVSCVITEKKCEVPPELLTSGINPDWSPDGKYIAYIAYGLNNARKVKVINTENNSYILDVTPPGVKTCLHPRWSPDSKKIAIDCYSDNNYDIFIIQLDDLRFANITNSPDIIDTGPEWSPDGSKIAFISDMDKDLGKCLIGECTLKTSALYTMTYDGTSITRLTFRNDEDISWLSWIP